MRTLHARLPFAVMLAVSVGAAGGVLAQLPTNAEHEAIAYSTTTPTDPIAGLEARILAPPSTNEAKPDRTISAER